MTEIKLEKIFQFIGDGKILEAFSAFEVLVAQLDTDLYNTAIILKSQFSSWDDQRIHGQNPLNEEKNRIIRGLTEIITKSESLINTIIKGAKKDEDNGNYYDAISKIEKILVIIESNELRGYKTKLSDSLLSKTSSHTDVETSELTVKSPFRLPIIVISLLILATPILAQFFNSEMTQIKLLYGTNLVLHLTLLFITLLYTIKPQIDVDDYIKNTTEYIRHRFDNNTISLKLFAERANETIKQFGVWWRWLIVSFLVLYVFYYLISLAPFFGQQSNTDELEVFLDVIFNAIEGFILFIIYRILTDDTIKSSSSKNKVFQEDLNIEYEIMFFVIFAFLFIVGYFGVRFQGEQNLLGGFSLIFRTLSSVIVAVGLCLVIGRLDSKFIEPKKWQLIILYCYAAIQPLFALFDKDLFIFVGGLLQNTTTEEIIKTVKNNVFEIKVIVLYLILLLKFYFISFILNMYKKNDLFKYFLLGSKLNDEIKKLKN